MISKRSLSVLVVIGLIFLYSSTANPASLYDIKSLEGLKGMYVLVEDLANEREIPFDENQIKEDSELKLRMAGIKVLSREEAYKTPGSPYLYINLNIRQMKNTFNISISVSLKQACKLERNPKISVVAPTWEARVLGNLGKDHAVIIRDKVNELVDKFVNDYLSVNPKSGK